MYISRNLNYFVVLVEGKHFCKLKFSPSGKIINIIRKYYHYDKFGVVMVMINSLGLIRRIWGTQRQRNGRLLL